MRVEVPLFITIAIAGLLSSCAASQSQAIRCSDARVWGTYLGADKKAGAEEIVGDIERLGVVLTPDQRHKALEAAEERLKWRMIRYLLLEGHNHNFGVVPVKGITRADGEPLVLYRSGITARPATAGSCFHSLIHQGGVRHALNLYNGDIDTRDLEVEERQTVTSAGGTYYAAREQPPAVARWRHELRDHPEDPKVRAAAMKTVAELINTQILRPGGEAPKGNVHVHCGGGMHRTGMVVGIIERCLNGLKRERIEANLKHHTAFTSEAAPGGYEVENLEFVMSFDCSLLHAEP